MQDDQVTPAEYVTKRPNSLVWQYARPLPKEFAHRFRPGEQWLDRESLRTRDLPEANRLARIRTGKWEATLQQWSLEDNARAAARITPEMAATLAQRVATRVLQDDQRLRKDHKAMQGLLRTMKGLQPAALSTLMISKPAPGALPAAFTSEIDAWQGLPGELAAFRDALHKGGEAHIAGSLANGRVAVVESAAMTEARALGFTFTRATPGALEAMQACLEAYREAWAGVRSRDTGKVVATPALPTAPKPAPVPPQPAGYFIADALDHWTKERRRDPKTAGVFKRHAAMFSDLMGNPALAPLTLQDGRRFRDAVRDWAMKEGRTADTANNVLSSVRAMLRLSKADSGLAIDPLEGMHVEEGGTDGVDRDPWAREDLPRLFDSPVFTQYALPTRAGFGLDAVYWVPLMLAYFGARPNEVAQLWTDDVFETAEGIAVEFRENPARGQKLKKRPRAKLSPSWRATPVHSELIRVGFRDYWQAVSAGGPRPLFPSLTFGTQNGPVSGVSKWFAAYKATRGFGPDCGRRLDLHSFRHTVRVELKFSGAGEFSRDIMGHAGKDVHDTSYGAIIRREVDRLRPHLERLQFPGLALPRVFKVPAWEPRKG